MSRSTKLFLYACIALLISSCSSVLGVVKKDQIEVDKNKRTFGSWVDDQTIERTVNHNIDKANETLDGAHVEVHSFNGVVLLTGEVPDAEARSIASAEAEKVPGVRIVHNELAISDNTSIYSRAGDTYLHKAVKLKLFGLDILDDTNIDVIIQDDVAYLMGIVTREQADAAAVAASETRGLRQVVKVFEYVE